MIVKIFCQMLIAMYYCWIKSGYSVSTPIKVKTINIIQAIFKGHNVYKLNGLMIKAIFLSSTIFSNSVLAINSIGYVKIREIKAWDTTIDVYFEDNQKHTCSDESHKTRYLADSRKEHHVSFLLSAFVSGKLVSISYQCQPDGYPMISGIRVK